MTPDGQFIAPPALPFAARLKRFAAAILALAIGGAMVFFLLSFAIALTAILFGGLLVSVAVYRFRLWLRG
jgi:hypothetical protein